jgi:long-chain acyl-CoA synthetase
VEDRVSSDKPWFQHYEPEVPRTLDVPDVGLHELFERTAAENPASIVSIFYGERLTYVQLDEQASRFAAGLQALGVEPGDRVGMILLNCPQFLVALLGVLKSGGVAVLLNPAYSTQDLKVYLNDNGVKAVVALDIAASRVQEIMSETTVERLIVTRMQDMLSPLMTILLNVKERREAIRTDLSGETVHRYFDIVKNSPTEYTRSEPKPGDAAVLLYTSGTVGAPKCVMLTHRNLVANALQMNSWLWDTRPQKHDIYFGVTPFFQSYGLLTVVCLAISSASAIVIVPRPALKDILRGIARWRPTIFLATPTIYNAIAHSLLSSSYDLRSIRVCLSGETPLMPNVQQAFESVTGARLLESYGMAEASHMTHCNPIYGERRAGSVGLPLPMTEARIVDPNSGAVLPVGEVGELVVSGPQVMAGYCSQRDEAEPVLRGGWLYTGDMALQDEEGYFYIKGRKQDLIKVNDQNVYPGEIEEALSRNEKVREVVVAGKYDKRHGDIIAAYVVLQPDVEATESELRRFAADQLADYKVPGHIEFRGSLPRTQSGKYLRRELSTE